MRKALAVAAVPVLLVAGCGGGDGPGASGSGGPPGPSVSAPPVTLAGRTNDRGTGDVSGTSGTPDLKLDLGDFSFAPTYIKVAPGAKVKLRLANTGNAPHTFTTGDGVDRVLQPGTGGTVEVAVGSSPYAFWCRFHRDGGMQGAFYTAPGGSAGTPDGDGTPYRY